MDESTISRSSNIIECFPEKSSKLETLANKYEEEHPIVLSTSSVTISSEPTLTKRFEDLTPEDQQEVLQRISGIDYKDATAVLSFGNVQSSLVSECADKIIRKYSTSTHEISTQAMSQLFSTLQKVPTLKPLNLAEIGDGKLFSRTHFNASANRAKKNISSVLAEYKDLSLQTKAISILLVNKQKDLLKNSDTFSQMYMALCDKLRHLELDFFALEKLHKIAQSESGKCTSSFEKETMRLSLERITNQIQTVKTSIVVTQQSIIQIGLLMRNNEIISRKYAELINITIPLWQWQYTIAVSAVKQQEAANLEKAIRKSASQVMSKTSTLLQDSLAETRKKVSAAYEAVEDLRSIQEYITKTIDSIFSVSSENSTNAVNALNSIPK